MTFFHLAQIFMYWGKRIKPSELPSFRRYLSVMLSRNRVLTVFNGINLECVLFYFLTDELDSFINRPMWSTPNDSEEGHIFFVDKMVSKHWTPSLRKLVQQEVESKFHKVDRAIWLREPNNRSVIIKKRGIVCTQLNG